MSTHRKDHVIYGWKLPFDIKDGNGESIDLWDDKFLPMIEGHEGEKFTLIIDSMCGKYTVFGLSVASGGDDENGWDFVSLDYKNLFFKKVTERFSEIFGFEPETKPELFIFSNYS